MITVDNNGGRTRETRDKRLYFPQGEVIIFTGGMGTSENVFFKQSLT